MDIQYEMSYSDKLKTVLAKANLAQVDLASLLNVSQKTVSLWVRGMIEPGRGSMGRVNRLYRLVENEEITNKAELVIRMFGEDSPDNTAPLESHSGEITKDTYMEGKGIVYELEKKNDSKIYAFPSTGKPEDHWYMVGGKSLLFYKYKVCDRLNRRCTIQPDRDTDYIFRHGVGSIRRGDTLVEQLRALRYKVEMIEGDIIAVDMGRHFTKKEMDELVVQAKSENPGINELKKLKYNMPNLAAAIRAFGPYVLADFKKLDKAYREVVVRELVVPVIELHKIYHRMANGDMEKKDAKLELMRRADDLAGVVIFIDEAGLVDVKKRSRLGSDIVYLKLMINEM